MSDIACHNLGKVKDGKVKLDEPSSTQILKAVIFHEERSSSVPASIQLCPNMLSSIFTVALLSLTALAAEQGKRQATNAAQFTAAADQLISEYIPSTAPLLSLESAISSAASAASVTGDALSLIYDGLLATSMPGWFSSAIPSGMATQIAALESNINALRVPTSGSVTVVIITTTDSAGSTITTSSTSTLATLTITTTSGVTATS